MTDRIVPLKNCAKSARWFLILPLLLLAAGCHRDEVKVYHVATDQEQQPQQAVPALPTNSSDQTLPPGHPDISSAPTTAVPLTSDSAQTPLTWTTPEGWTEVPPTEMRVASFKVPGANGKQADVSIVPLPGMAGTDSANVNRWRGQVGLPVVTDDEVQKLAENVEAGGQPAQLYDITGQNPAIGETSRILGVIQHRGDATWFFKMTGNADLVEQQKPAFVEFLKSLKFPTTTPIGAAGEMPATLPPGHPAIGDMNTPAAASGPISHDGQPNWQIPVGWQEVSAGQFLVAKFMLTGDGGAAAAVNVSMSAGDGGGLTANVNRWRGQLGLAPLSDDDLNKSLTTVASTSGTAQLVDFSGVSAQTGQPVRLVGVIVSLPDRTWFYKLMGDAKIVAGQKDTFTQFVQSANYSDAH
jgi:hypothetical protein